MLKATGDTAAAAGSATTTARPPNAASSSSRCSERYGLVQYSPQAGPQLDRFEDQERGVQREETTCLCESPDLRMGVVGLSVFISIAVRMTSRRADIFVKVMAYRVVGVASEHPRLSFWPR